MSAGGGEYIGPPVPNGDNEQDANQNRVRGKKEGDFAVRESKRPGDLRGDVIANGARQNVAHRAERRLGGAFLWSGAYPSRGFAFQQLFTLVAGNLSHLFGGSPSVLEATRGIAPREISTCHLRFPGAVSLPLHAAHPCV